MKTQGKQNGCGFARAVAMLRIATLLLTCGDRRGTMLLPLNGVLRCSTLRPFCPFKNSYSGGEFSCLALRLVCFARQQTQLGSLRKPSTEFCQREICRAQAGLLVGSRSSESVCRWRQVSLGERCHSVPTATAKQWMLSSEAKLM